MPLIDTLNGRTWRALCCALFCSVALPHVALAIENIQLTERHIASYEAMDEAARVRTLLQLAQTGAHPEAEWLLQRYPLTGPHAQNRTLFIEGLILRGRGDLTGAAKKMRAALANDPNLTMVRTELAKILVALDENDSAKHHLELLAADAPSAQDAAGIRSFMDSIDQRKPYSFSSFISLVPSTNINNGSGQNTVYSPVFGGDLAIDEDSQKQAGFGVSAGISGAYNKRLGNDWSFIAAGGLSTLVYDDLKFNSISLSQSVELRRKFARGYLGFGLVASESFDIDESHFSSYGFGPRLSARFDASAQDVLTASTTYEFKDFNADGDSDGWTSMSDMAWTHLISSSASLTLYGGLDLVDQGVDYLSYDTMSAGFNVYKELSHGITVTTGAEARMTGFDGVNPIAGEVREDLRLIGGVTLTKRDLVILGFAPALNYTYVHNGSNIAIYDYDSHSVDFRLTKDF